MAISWIVCAVFFILSTVVAEACTELASNNVTLLTSQIGNILGSTTLQTTTTGITTAISACNSGASTLDLLSVLSSVFGSSMNSTANSSTLVNTLTSALITAVSLGSGLNLTNVVDIGDVLTIQSTVNNFNVSALYVNTTSPVLIAPNSFNAFVTSTNSIQSGASTSSLTYNPSSATSAQQSACLSDYQSKLIAIQSGQSAINGNIYNMGNNTVAFSTDATTINNTMVAAGPNATTITTPGASAQGSLNQFLQDANTKVASDRNSNRNPG